MNLLPKQELAFVNDRLCALGFSSLGEYWASQMWATRKWYYWKTHEKICRRCGADRRIQLHHITYEHLGCEPDCDFEPLCFRCHQKYHRKITKKIRPSGRTVIPASVRAGRLPFNQKYKRRDISSSTRILLRELEEEELVHGEGSQ